MRGFQEINQVCTFFEDGGGGTVSQKGGMGSKLICISCYCLIWPFNISVFTCVCC